MGGACEEGGAVEEDVGGAEGVVEVVGGPWGALGGGGPARGPPGPLGFVGT